MNPQPRPVHPAPPGASEKVRPPAAPPIVAFSPDGPNGRAAWKRYADSRLRQFAAR